MRLITTHNGHGLLQFDACTFTTAKPKIKDIGHRSEKILVLINDTLRICYTVEGGQLYDIDLSEFINYDPETTYWASLT